MSEAAVIAGNPQSASVTVGGSILIIDDEAEIRESLQTVLELEGFSVATAPTGEAGLQRLGEQPFDLVLLDLACPDATAWTSSPTFTPSIATCQSS